MTCCEGIWLMSAEPTHDWGLARGGLAASPWTPDRLRVFFCVGAAKSGTTLLARVLDQHPDIACLWESYAFHPRSPSSIFNPASQSWRKHGFAEEDVRRWAREWRRQPQALLRRGLRRLTGRTFLATGSFRRTMPEALSDFARRCGVSVVGDKWPMYVDYLDTVLRVFPEARLIYNVRDPRGLWNSGERFKGRKRGDELLGRMLDADRRVAPYLKRTTSITLRYEDLVAEPEATCRKLYAFLGCDSGHARDDSHPYPGVHHLEAEAQVQGDPSPDLGLDLARWDWVPEAGQPIDPRHASKWRQQMSRQEIERITERAGWFMERYEYER
jgi:hypothetical protein